MDTIQLKKLLEKFYNGETDSMEERILFHYFHSPEVSSEFQEDKDVFVSLFEARNITLSGGTYLDLLENAIHKKSFSRRILHHYFEPLKYAAAILIMVFAVSGYWFYRNKEMNKQHNLYADTYTDPRLAMEETKKALLLVSSKLNKGTQPLNHLGKFNHGMQQLNSVSIILTPPKKN